MFWPHSAALANQVQVARAAHPRRIYRSSPVSINHQGPRSKVQGPRTTSLHPANPALQSQGPRHSCRGAMTAALWHWALGPWSLVRAPCPLPNNPRVPSAIPCRVSGHPRQGPPSFGGVTPAFPPLRKRCQPDPHPPFLAPLAVGKPLSCLVAKFCWVYFCLDLLPTNKTPRRAQHCRRAVAGPRTEVRGPCSIAPVRCGRGSVAAGPWSVDRGPCNITPVRCRSSAVGVAPWTVT